MDILDLLRSDGSIIVNKKIANKIGLHEAVILSELIARFKWHQKENKDNNGWFYCTKDTLEKQTSLNRYYQDKAIEKLIELKLIDKKTTDIPAKRYFCIDEKQVASLVMGQIVRESQTSMRESNKQDSNIVANKNVTESQEVIQNNNTKDNTNNKSNSCSDSDEQNEVKFDETTKPYQFAAYLRDKIKENNNRQPVPNETPEDLEDWAIELDRLNRLGTVGAKDKGYTWNEIQEIIDWCQDDSFWKKNIKSAGKLREQVIQLEERMKTDKNNNQTRKAADF